MLIVHIMQIRSFVCLSPTLAAVSGRSAAGPPGPRVSQMFLSRENLFTPVKFTLAAGAYSWRPIL